MTADISKQPTSHDAFADFSPEDHDWDNDCVTYKKDGILLSKWMIETIIEDIKVFEVRDDDLWLITYPKSGTTWMQQIMALISVGGDQEKLTMPLSMYIPFIELMAPAPHYSLIDKSDATLSLQRLAEAPSPRMIKSHLQDKHLPQQLLEKKAKVIYVARNPKDVAVSSFHFHTYNRILPKYTDWNQFYEDYVRDEVLDGSWFDHNLFWWKQRNLPNVLFLKYEDMKKDLKGVVIQVADFMGHNLSDDAINNVVQHSTFTSMKSSEYMAQADMTSSDRLGLRLHKIVFDTKVYKDKLFIRKGKTGDWKNYFTVAQNEEYDKMYNEKMKGSELKFDFEI